MRIERSRILKLDNYIGVVPSGASIRIVSDITRDSTEILQRAGFEPEPQPGATILPTARGAVSRFNADGRWNVLRDQTKEIRYIRTLIWRRRQWSGRDQFEEHEDLRDIFRECYPREFVSPPSIQITYLEIDKQRLVASPPLKNDPDHYSSIRHVVNLFLELFTVCAIVTGDLTRYVPAESQTVNWRLLPPGEYPWERLQTHLKHALQSTGKDTQRIIADRLETVQSHNPDRTYVGARGFK